ncbi:MAG: extracellular solute-binding protein [Clostridia bacterium]
MKKRILALTLALAMSIPFVFSGCSSDTTVEYDENGDEIRQVVEIDWFIAESWFSSTDGNLALELMQNATDTKINYIVAVGDATEKLNAYIASNTLPDMVTMGWWNSQVQEISIPEYTYSYNELIDMVPELGEYLDESVFNWYQSEDGNTYTYPCNSVSQADIDAGLTSNRTFLVRKDIYEAIGSPDMSTQEGFLQALADAKEMFPEALNGDPLIPFGTTEFTTTGNTGLEDMLLEFLAVPREIDGVFEPVINGNPSEDYISWLKTFRQANEDGLLSVDIFIDDRTQIEEKIQQGRYFALMYQAQDAMNPIGQLYTNNPDSCYIAIDGPKNADGDDHALAVPGYSGWEVTFVTQNAENPERIAELLAWGHSDEGQNALYFGEEGVTYDVVDGVNVIKEEIVTLKNDDMATFKQQYNIYNEYWMFANSSNLLEWETEALAPFDQYDEWSVGKAAFYGIYDNVAPASDSEEAEIATRVNVKWGEVLPKLLQAESEEAFDQIWSEFEQYKTDNNYDLYLEYIRARVEDNKAKFE